MKKVVLSVIVSLTTVLALPLTAYASTANVAGYITDTHGNGINGASVTATCTHNKKTATGSVITQTINGQAGGYAFQIKPSGVCISSDTVSVTASAKGYQTKTVSGTFANIGSGVHIALVSVSLVSLPEMSTFTGLAAAVAAGGAFLVIRRKQVGRQ